MEAVVSYRIARVRFAPNGSTYPVNCLRADILPGSRVVVLLPSRDSKLQRAEVTAVEYLNWNCSNTIVGLISEVTISPDGTYTVARGPRDPNDVDTVRELAERLFSSGWCHYFPTSNIWRVVYTKAIRGLACFILIRANGIDYVTCLEEMAPKPEGRKLSMVLSNGRSVRHGYHGSGVDLYRFTMDFAKAFGAGTGNLDDFFVARGGPQPRPSASRSRSDLADIYDAISNGEGGPAYLGDGIYISPSDF